MSQRTFERANVFSGILVSRSFLIVTVSTTLAYLAFFKYLDLATGSEVMATASYFVLFYLLVGVSSLLMGLNVYSLRSKLLIKRMARSNATSGPSSAAMSLLGGVISCSCHTSLLLPLLTFLGASAISGIGIITALVEYQFWILIAFIVLDLILVFRVLRKIKRSEGSVREPLSLPKLLKATRFPKDQNVA
ncbi:MAG: hypothetical protein LYZ70_07495 [Nitrososphaerales archaeon]|nr:hypothetical protein [Nitrososphaerales archaeon]